MKISKPLAGILIAVICVGVVLTVRAFLSRQSLISGSPAYLALRQKGSAVAPIRVVEFTDFECPACAHAAQDIKGVMEKYPGKVQVTLRYFPLSGHRFARRAAIFSECAGDQGRFWPFHDALYQGQASWKKLTAVDQNFSELAVSLGMDGVRLMACVNGGAMESRIEWDLQEGRRRGVNATPTFFVNGKMVVGGKNFREEIERLLNTNGK